MVRESITPQDHAMATSAPISKTYTISLPPDLAAKAEALEARESRTMSDLFREAFQIYNAQQVRKSLAEIAEYAASRNPSRYAKKTYLG